MQLITVEQFTAAVFRASKLLIEFMALLVNVYYFHWRKEVMVSPVSVCPLDY